MTEDMLKDNDVRIKKIMDSIDELDVSVEGNSDDDDARSFEETKYKIEEEVKEKSYRIKTEQKQKNVLKLGFITPGLWDENDAKYCLASDKQQENDIIERNEQQKDKNSDHKKKNLSFMPDLERIIQNFSYQNLILSQNSWFTNFWFGIDILSCIISSYLYAYMGTFGSNSLTTTGDRMVTFFEVVFVLSIIINFTTEYKPDGISKPVRDFKKIAIRYLHNGFIMDLLMVIPFNYIFGRRRNSKLAYFIKTYRLVKGIRIFNVSQLISRI